MRNKMNQVVLDFDLDCVMNRQDHTSSSVGRRDLSMRTPSVRSFEKFLDALRFHQNSDGLGFESHTMSAKIWEQMIINGTLIPPFTVIHVDAHHDIYPGATGVKKPSVHCGNYLVPFLKAGLIDKLVWIAPRSCGNWNDSAWRKMGCLQLISKERKDLGVALGCILGKRSYAFATIAFSPNYCSVKADALIPSLMTRLRPSVTTMEIMKKLANEYKNEFTRAMFYLMDSPYFDDQPDGLRSSIYIPRLVSRMYQ